MNKNLFYIICAISTLILCIGLIYAINIKDRVCVSKNSILYIGDGKISDLQRQEFGIVGLVFLNKVDCVKQEDKCNIDGIRVLPTWIINNQTTYGKLTMNQLKNMTNC